MITINDQEHSEYLLSVGYDTNMEIYDLKEQKVISNIATKSFTGILETMDCLRQTGINYFDGNNYYLFYGYLTLDLDFYLKKLKFTSTDLSKVTTEKTIHINHVRGRASSCYITEKNNIGCITITTILLTNNLYAYIYDLNLKELMHTSLDGYQVVPEGVSFPYFIKCIHLKKEIGVFAFYRKNSVLKMVNNPVLLFKNFTGNKLENYLPQVILDYKEFCYDALFNDLIKINENKLCYIGTSENKEEMYIVLLNIYQNSSIVIRYYNFNIFSLYTFKFYKNMRANLYNNFIAYAFSFCRTENCKDTDDVHYPGFMIFNYPNGTDISKNLIDLMFSRNEKIENYTINLYDQVRIDNNIFGLKSSHIIIKSNNCNFMILYSSKNDLINQDYHLDEDENIIAKIQSFDKNECFISYLYYITEPDFEEYNKYPTKFIFPDTYKQEDFVKEKDIYESRLLYYKISIN